MNQTYYVYALKDSLTGKVFYVGKSSRGRKVGRFYDHCWRAKKGSKLPVHCKMRSVWAKGGHVTEEVLFESDNEGLVLNEEMRQIALFGRDNLMNLTDGGEPPNGMRHSEKTKEILRQKSTGFRHSPETIARMKEAARQRWAKRSPEVRKQILSKAATAAIVVNRNREITPTMREALIAGRRDRIALMTPEQRASIAARINSKPIEQRSANASAAAKKLWASLTPEQKQAKLEHIRAGKLCAGVN
jgi:hypothetical protein